jgi:A/G-specific adenine glycosylase
MGFSDEILHWYASNKRDLPWRNTKDPYKIWLSEIMLQQTRVAQGLPYYEKFIRHFPTVSKLSEASEKKVLKLWQGLGYYSRARNLHTTAKNVTREMGGRFPDTYDGLLQLKGVGDYTASAIASICFGKPEPVVDGNVYRVLARFFGVDLAVNSSGGVRYFKELAREVMDTDMPGEYNQAIMEFGARQCTPSKPDCRNCPLNNGCIALQQQRIAQLPVKTKKPEVRRRYFNYLVPIDKEYKTLLQQRQEAGIWRQLYEFPLLESDNRVAEEEIMEWLPEKFTRRGKPVLLQGNEKEIVHKLSHQHLYTRFWILQMQERLEGGIPIAELDEYPVPVLIADFIKTLKNSYF